MKILDKINIFVVIIIMFLFGYMERKDFAWLIDQLGSMGQNLLP